MKIPVTAPVLGVVTLIFAETGTQVSKDDVVMQIESMKYFFDVVVPEDGTFELATSLGQLVDENGIVGYINR